jgi:hypothetical protein
VDDSELTLDEIMRIIDERIASGYQARPWTAKPKGFPRKPITPNFQKKYTRPLSVGGRSGWYVYPEMVTIPPNAYVQKPSTWDGAALAAKIDREEKMLDELAAKPAKRNDPPEVKEHRLWLKKLKTWEAQDARKAQKLARTKKMVGRRNVEP